MKQFLIVATLPVVEPDGPVLESNDEHVHEIWTENNASSRGENMEDTN